MRTRLAVLFVLIFCAPTQFGRVALGATKIPVNEIKAVACVVENKGTGERDEIDRMPFAGLGGLWAINDKCKKISRERAKKKELSDWGYLCCPITNDDKVHCESPFGTFGKW